MIGRVVFVDDKRLVTLLVEKCVICKIVIHRVDVIQSKKQTKIIALVGYDFFWVANSIFIHLLGFFPRDLMTSHSYSIWIINTSSYRLSMLIYYP